MLSVLCFDPAQMSRDASKAEALQETLQAAVSLGAAQVAEGEGLAGQLKAKVAALEADVQAKEMRVAELQGDVNALSSKLASAAEELKGRVEGLAAKEGELSEAVQKSRSLQVGWGLGGTPLPLAPTSRVGNFSHVHTNPCAGGAPGNPGEACYCRE